MVEQFNGRIELDVRDSVPDWAPYELKKAPEGSPNVLVILYDDTGMAAWSHLLPLWVNPSSRRTRCAPARSARRHRAGSPVGR